MLPKSGKIEDGGPTQCDVSDHVKPARCVEPCNTKNRGENGSAPYCGKQDGRLAMVKEVDRERGIASGDQNGDVGVVDPAPEGLCLRLPANSVINSATGKEGHGCERENPQSDPPLEAVSGCYQD